MSGNGADRATVDWLTTMAISAIAVSLVGAFHEGIHALSCVAVGGDLREFSALHVACENPGTWQGKLVSGGASVANVILGTVFLYVLRNARRKNTEWQYFCWLFMLVNWLKGAGYWVFSGVADVGDWANVIDGWQPVWFWRVFMTLAGSGAYLSLVWLALKELGRIIGGRADEQIGRAVKLGLISYFTAVLVVLLAGSVHPYGMGSLPVIAGTMAILGGLSPLLWMMQWFRAAGFVKRPNRPLEIHRRPTWIAGAVVAVALFAGFLGRTVYF